MRKIIAPYFVEMPRSAYYSGRSAFSRLAITRADVVWAFWKRGAVVGLMVLAGVFLG